MGFFGKLFEKKECSICGGEIGLLGNRKLEDGNCCKNCANQLSPWFDDRRHSTVEQIRQQIADREANRRNLDGFRPDKRWGQWHELLVELENGVPRRFVVAKTNDYLEENADLIRFDQVTSIHIDIDESHDELKRRNSEGEEVSYNPPRYEYSYDFYVELNTTSPYYDDIRFRLNRSTLNLETTTSSRPVLMRGVHSFDPTLYPEYREYKAMCDEIEEVFRCGMQGIALAGYAPIAAAEPEAAPVAAPRFCSSCGAPAEGGKFCQYCGSPL